MAALGVYLKHVPPFLLTGLALLTGSTLALPELATNRRAWRIPAATLALGVYGLFGFHFLLFIALRNVPPVEANLVNDLWPLLMVLLAPVLLRGLKLRALHVAAALMGFTGAAIAILGDGCAAGGGGWSWGYVPALASAFIWASCSLATQRVKASPTAVIGLFGLVSGLLSLLCHWALEPQAELSSRDWLLILVMGLGPLGTRPSSVVRAET